MPDAITKSLDQKIKNAISGVDRANELLQRAKRILEHMGKQLPPCEGVCPMCGKVWDNE